MKQYELVLVLEGKATSAKKKSVTEKMEKLIGALGGKITETADWGARELAYPINKINTGVFLLMTLELDSKGAKDLNARLRLEDSVIRHLFIKKEEPTRLISARIFKHTQQEKETE